MYGHYLHSLDVNTNEIIDPLFLILIRDLGSFSFIVIYIHILSCIIYDRSFIFLKIRAYLDKMEERLKLYGEIYKFIYVLILFIPGAVVAVIVW